MGIHCCSTICIRDVSLSFQVFGCERVWKANDILNIGEESFGVPPQAELERDKVPPPKTVSSGAHVYHTPPENVATSSKDLESHHSNSASDLEDDEWDKSNPLAVCFADEEYGHSSSRVKLKKIPPDVHVRPDTLLPSVRLSTEDVVSKCKSLPPDDKAGSKLRELFESLTTLTAKEDMLRTIRCVCRDIPLDICACMYYMYVRIYVCMYVHMYACMYLCMYVCMYV